MAYIRNQEDAQRTVYGIEEFFLNLDKKDFKALVVQVYGVPQGTPAGAVTHDMITSGFSDIKLMDGQDDKDPPFVIDGQDIDVVLHALNMITKVGHYDDDGTNVTLNLHKKKALDTTDGKDILFLPIAQYLSKMKTPILFFKTRDPTTWYDYATTEPTGMEFTVNVDFSVESFAQAIGVRRYITDMRKDHKITMPENMNINAIAIVFSNGYVGTVEDIEILDDGDQEVRLDDAERMKFIEQVEAEAPTNFGDDFIFINDLSVDGGGVINLDLTDADDPTIYFFGTTHVASIKPDASVKDVKMGRAVDAVARVGAENKGLIPLNRLPATVMSGTGRKM